MESSMLNESQEETRHTSLDQIIQITVRALMNHQQQTNENTRANNVESVRDVSTIPPYKTSEIAALLPEFSGHVDDVKRWVLRLEMVQATYGVPYAVMYLISVGKLTKQTMAWYHSKIILKQYPAYKNINIGPCIIGARGIWSEAENSIIIRALELKPNQIKQLVNDTTLGSIFIHKAHQTIIWDRIHRR
ncbi:hypothetical protein RN001_006320 [Aquatica leii]|uniref:Uncharacterized protein n=1 Tax=Aquatica leii TaxID=1421715 RepID=A0AAN7PIE4_9COLE|nr:hypothetical protein RN001_006320 [Aquatica leii]